MNDFIMSFAQFGGMALIAGVLLYAQMQDNKRKWDYMDKLQKSIDALSDKIERMIEK